MINKTLLYSKYSLIFLVVLLAFMANLEFKQYRDQKAIEAQKASLQEQADSLSKKNRELNESLAYLNSTDFKERVARQQMNLKKEGEVVYGFTEADGSALQAGQQKAADSNFVKWWKYFFMK